MRSSAPSIRILMCTKHHERGSKIVRLIFRQVLNLWMMGVALFDWMDFVQKFRSEWMMGVALFDCMIVLWTSCHKFAVN